MRLVPALLVLLASVSHGQSADEPDVKHQLLERAFGHATQLDPATIEKVKALPPGERLWIDTDGDGTNDEVWYIDAALRHRPQTTLLLVRAVDEDGDLDEHKGPDLDSDLYVGDWGADGTVDAIVDYQDNDGDDDVDEMGIFWYAEKFPGIDRPAILVFWSRDDGDDNLLWYDIALTYRQHACQYRSHFNGDEVFATFALPADLDHWVPLHENPFVFYDPDGDGVSEVVMRWAGFTDAIKTLRYSFDADDDAGGERVHDYDFSITALAPSGSEADLTVPDEFTTSATLRGIPTKRFLDPKHAESFAARAPWAKTLLTWDEMNANTAGDLEYDPNERWEGVINNGSENFPRVGAPASSPFNKRNEVCLDPTAPLKLYYDPTDRRLHLKGATEGWLEIDYDLDGEADARVACLDDDKDGVFDRRRLDLDLDGEVDFDWKMNGSGAREFDLEFEAISTFYKQLLASVLSDSQEFIDVARLALSLPSGEPTIDPAERFFLTELESRVTPKGRLYPVRRIGKQMRKTPAAARLYVDLVRDRLLLSLKQQFGQKPAWQRIESLYAAGDYTGAAEIVAQEFLPSDVRPNPKVFRAFTHRVPILIDNTGGPLREHWPVTIRLADIQAVAADFNQQNCAVVAPDRWLDWRQVPHQIDELDAEVGPQLSFLIEAGPEASATWYVYYAPTGKSDEVFAPNTDTIDDWYPPNIGWESDRIAYRTYWGQFDFFGKMGNGLVFDGFEDKAYHDEKEWGIDALLVGASSGLGGLTLYLDDRAYPVQNHNGTSDMTFETRVLASGPVRSAVEIVARNVVPTRPEPAVRTRCLIYAERQETEIRVSVDNDGREVVIAPGFVKLARETTFDRSRDGYFGSWGLQSPVIGEIGMGLIAPPKTFEAVADEPSERRIKYRTTDGGKFRYWLIADWRRGRQFPVAPTAEDWRKQLHDLSKLLLNEPGIAIGAPESVH